MPLEAGYHTNGKKQLKNSYAEETAVNAYIRNGQVERGGEDQRVDKKSLLTKS